MPLSAKAIVTMPPRTRPSTITAPPSGVDFTAFDRRLSAICLSARRSALRWIAGAISDVSERSFSWARPQTHAQAVGKDAIELHVLGRKPDAAGLDLRHVENVVDDVEQILAAFADVAGIFLVFFGAERPEHRRFHDL